MNSPFDHAASIVSQQHMRWRAAVREHFLIDQRRQRTRVGRVVVTQGNPVSYRVDPLRNIGVVNIGEALHQSCRRFQPASQQRDQSFGRSVTQETVRSGERPGQTDRGEVNNVVAYCVFSRND